MDFGAFEIGGVSVLLLVLGIVEAAKQFGLKGRGSKALAIALGVFFVGLTQAMETGLIPEVALPWITMVVIGLGGGLAATGMYDLARRLLQREG